MNILWVPAFLGKQSIFRLATDVPNLPNSKNHSLYVRPALQASHTLCFMPSFSNGWSLGSPAHLTTCPSSWTRSPTAEEGAPWLWALTQTGRINGELLDRPDGLTWAIFFGARISSWHSKWWSLCLFRVDFWLGHSCRLPCYSIGYCLPKQNRVCELVPGIDHGRLACFHQPRVSPHGYRERPHNSQSVSK